MKETSSKLVFYLMTGIYIITLALKGGYAYNYLVYVGFVRGNKISIQHVQRVVWLLFFQI